MKPNRSCLVSSDARVSLGVLWPMGSLPSQDVFFYVDGSPRALSSHLLLLLCLVELWSPSIHLLVYVYPLICSLPDQREGRHLVEESTHTFDGAGHTVNSCCCLNLDVLLYR